MVDISIVIPVKNSQPLIQHLSYSIIDYCINRHIAFELILCNDGSENTTAKVLKEIKNTYPLYVTIITLPKSYGQHFATYAGMLHHKGHCIFTCDDDIVFTTENFDAIMQQTALLSTTDLIYFVNQRYDIIAEIKFFVVKFFIFLSAHQYPPRYGASQRLFTSLLAKTIITHSHRFFYIDALLIKYAANTRVHKQYFQKNKHLHITHRYTFINRIALLSDALINYNIQGVYVVALAACIVAIIGLQNWVAVLFSIITMSLISIYQAYIYFKCKKFLQDIVVE